MANGSSNIASSNLPIWIIAVALSAIVAIVLLLLFGCAGFLFVYLPMEEHRQRQEIIRREPWRNLLPNHGF